MQDSGSEQWIFANETEGGFSVIPWSIPPDPIPRVTQVASLYIGIPG